jgi:hypothetical protein
VDHEALPTIRGSRVVLHRFVETVSVSKGKNV